MSNEEVIELQELRKERELQAKKIQSLEFEIEDNDMARRSLNSWKRFRWVGFFIALQAFVITMVFAYLHLRTIDESVSGLYENMGDTVVSSISTVSVVFALLLLIILAIVCVVLGVRLFMELGESDAARLMAKARFRKNYYTEMEKIADQRKILDRSMYEEKIKLKFMLPRLEELEGMEKSWT